MNKRMMFRLSTGEEFRFALNPQDYSIATPSRVNVIQTKGGVFADNFGTGVTVISIKGITKNNFVRTSDGNVRNKALDTFKELRDKIVLGYFSGQVPGLPPNKTMEFWNFTDEDYYEVIPMQFTLTRSSSKPLFYNYDINLVVVRKLTDPEPTPTDIVEESLEKSEEYQKLFPLTPSLPTLLPDHIINPDKETESPTTPLPFVLHYGNNAFFFNIQEVSKTDLSTYIKEHGYSFVPNLAYVSPDLANTKPTELGAILINKTTGAMFLVGGVDFTLPPNTIRIEIPSWKNDEPTYMSVVTPADIDYGVLPIIRQIYSKQNYDTPPLPDPKPVESTTINLLYPFEKLRMDYFISTQNREQALDPLEQQLLNREYERMQIVKELDESHEYNKQVREILNALNVILLPEDSVGGDLDRQVTSDIMRAIRIAQAKGEYGVTLGSYGTVVFTKHLTEAIPALHHLSDEIALEKKILMGIFRREIYPAINKPTPVDINTTESETLAAYGHVLGLERMVTDVLALPPNLREEAENVAKDMLYEDGLIGEYGLTRSLEDLYQDLIDQGIFTGGTASSDLINHLHQMQFPGAIP